MKLYITATVCKILHFIGKLLGKGSSLPGQIALRLYPDILKQLDLPGIIIAVTGSNGKTSASEMIAHALEAAGMSVGWNREGSNQTEGIATTLLCIADASGKVKRDALVLECDERYARRIFTHFKPTVLVVTNLCRDQLSRNGHPEFIQDCIRDAIGAAGKDVKLVLNADDPYVAALAASSSDVLWFGIKPGAAPEGFRQSLPDPGTVISHQNRLQIITQLETRGESGELYNDGAFCPVCKERMIYKYRISGHLGDYRCSSCSHKRPEPGISVTDFDHWSGNIRFNNKSKLTLWPPTLTGAYNLCAAIAAAGAAGVDDEHAVRSLNDYKLTGGRTVRFSIGEREGLLLISKHENSLSYNQSFARVAKHGAPSTVVIMVDSISRKYYTSETSWLWDVDFEILMSENVRNIVLTGRYSNELLARFAMTAIEADVISCVTEPRRLREFIERNTTGDVFAITCFSDKAKLLKALK